MRRGLVSACGVYVSDGVGTWLFVYPISGLELILSLFSIPFYSWGFLEGRISRGSIEVGMLACEVGGA